MSRITLRSQSVAMEDPKVAQEAIVSDLQNVGLELNRRQVLLLSGGDRIEMPTAGTAKIYGSSAITTVGSTGANYFIVTALRDGQDETGVTRDSRDDEITEYSEFFLGVVAVAKGTVITLRSAMTGLLYPILTNANLSLRIELGPQATVR